MTNGNKDAEWLFGMEEFEPGMQHAYTSKVHAAAVKKERCLPGGLPAEKMICERGFSGRCQV